MVAGLALWSDLAPPAGDPEPARRARFEDVLGIRSLEDNTDGVSESDLVVVATKARHA